MHTWFQSKYLKINQIILYSCISVRMNLTFVINS